MSSPLKARPSSASRNTLAINSLVMFEHDQLLLLGVLYEIKKDRFRVLSERGRDVELTAQRLHLLPGTMPADIKARDAQQKFLQNLRNEAEAFGAQIKLDELWSVMKERAQEWSEHEIAELLFNAPTLLQYTALRLRLLTDRIFFKRDTRGFIPRSEEIIEELKRAEEVRLEKKNIESQTVDFISKRFKGERIEIPAKLHGMIRILEECAASSERIDHSKQKEVKELLQLVSDRTSTELHGSLEERAFLLLCKIGHFNKNTNLSFYRHNPKRTFNSDALEEAAQFMVPEKIADLPAAYQGHCLDLSKLTTFTIDDASTKDMDDALSIEQTADGYRLGIHISNVTIGIKEESALEREAIARSTSIYTSDTTINMLPEILAEEKISLCAGKVRPALSCIFELDHRLNIISSSLTTSLIKVSQRLSYDQVDHLLAHEDHDMNLLYNIASQKEQKRLEAGAIRVQKGDATIVVTPEQLELVEIDEQSPARSLVGEMMVLANSFMARFAEEKNIPLIFRGQPAPDKGKSVDPRIPDGPARDYAYRTLLKKSTISFTPQRHASLGLEAYAQITSPIRRFADIINQRQLIHYLLHGQPQYTPEQLELFVSQTEETLNKANLISRESKRFWLLRYIEEQSKKNNIIYGTLIRTDLKTPIVELDQTYLTVPLKCTKTPALGEYLKLKVVSVKPHDDQIRLEIAS